MNTFLKKSSALILGFFLAMNLISFALPAQANLFSDPLQNIKDRLGEKDASGKKIEVIDFSESKPFGNLSQEVIDVLKEEGFENLTGLKEHLREIIEELKEALEPGKIMTSEEEVEAQMKVIEGFGLTNAQANQVYAEMTFRGESQIHSVLITVVQAMRNLIAGVAIVIIVLAGLKLTLAQGEETAITEQKRHLIFAGVGLGAILLIEQLVYAIYGTPGTVKEITERGAEFSSEILALVAYLKTLIGILTTLMIIISGARILTAMGQEDKITQFKKGVLWIVVGLVIIIINQVLIENIFILPDQANPDSPTIGSENVNAVIAVVANVVKFALGFTGLIAFVILVYGAVLLIANYTKEDQVEKAKKIIKYALFGIIVILSAFALMATLIDFS